MQVELEKMREEAQALIRQMKPDANKWDAADLELKRQADAIYAEIARRETNA